MIMLDVAKKLHSAGIGIFDENGSTGNIILDSMPDEISELIAIYQRTGLEADPLNEYYYPTVQIMVRGANKIQTRDKAQSIINLLNGFHGYLVAGSHRVIDCTPLQSVPVDLGMNDHNKYEFSININIEHL